MPASDQLCNHHSNHDPDDGDDGDDHDDKVLPKFVCEPAAGNPARHMKSERRIRDRAEE